VTIAVGPDEVVRDVLRRPDLAPEQTHRFVLLLLLCTADRFLAHLREVEREVAALEDQLQSSLANEEVLGLLRYQKGLVHFTTALASNRILLERIQKDPGIGLSPEDHDLLEDVLVEFRQAAETSAVASDILSQMMDAFASIISNNLNVVMKFLASLTLIVAVPTLVASFYGMNVGLPGAHSPAAFAVLAGVSAMASIALAWLFARRRWL
jgi:magnesium transporter